MRKREVEKCILSSDQDAVVVYDDGRFSPKRLRFLKYVEREEAQFSVPVLNERKSSQTNDRSGGPKD